LGKLNGRVVEGPRLRLRRFRLLLRNHFDAAGKNRFQGDGDVRAGDRRRPAFLGVEVRDEEFERRLGRFDF